MFKYEMHLHTRQGSKCSASEGKEYVEFYRSLGYTGMVVTDHFFHGNTRPDRKLPWHQYMEEYLGGYYDAKEAAEGKDFDVFFGVEELFDYVDEYLIYGLEPEWFISHPEIKDMKTSERAEYLGMARESGAFIIQAHPFRYRASYYTRDRHVVAPSLVDGYEIFNSCNEPEHNKLAVLFAEGEKDKVVISGSDRHKAEDYISTPGGIILPERVGNIHELIDTLKQGKHTLMGIETMDNIGNDVTPALPVQYI